MGCNVIFWQGAVVKKPITLILEIFKVLSSTVSSEVKNQEYVHFGDIRNKQPRPVEEKSYLIIICKALSLVMFNRNTETFPEMSTATSCFS